MKKYLQITTTKALWLKWKSLSDEKGMPLVTYIKHLLQIEIDKKEDA